MNIPFFTVVVPLYNKETCIRETLEGILAQRYRHFEIVVVDDGSTDNSVEVVQALQSNQIRIIRKENGGVASARNRGIEEAKGDWIVFFDADDTMYPNALEEYAKMIADYADAEVLISSYDVSVKRNISLPQYHYCTNFFRDTVRYYARGSFYLAWTGVVCAKKECLQSLGGFNEDYTHGEDIDMWYRLVSRFVTVKSDVVTAMYQLSAPNRVSHRKDRPESKHSPLAVIRPRNTYYDFYEKIWVGLNVVHAAFPKGWKSNPGMHAKRLLKYADWAFIYGLYLVKYRLLKSKF